MNDLMSQFTEIGVLPVAKSATNANGVKKVNPKVKFVSTGTTMIQELNAGTKTHSAWYAQRENGGFAVTFRNGNKVMELRPGCPIFNTDTTEQAIAVIAAGIKLCEDGALDDIFTEQAKKKLAA